MPYFFDAYNQENPLEISFGEAQDELWTALPVRYADSTCSFRADWFISNLGCSERLGSNTNSASSSVESSRGKAQSKAEADDLGGWGELQRYSEQGWAKMKRAA